jgi:hypothetical protein
MHMTFRRILTAVAFLLAMTGTLALAPTTYAAAARQDAASAMPEHIAVTTYGVLDNPYGAVPVTVTYHLHSFSADAYGGTLLAQAHVHALSPNTNDQLSFPMHMVSLTLPVGVSLYGDQLFLRVGPGRTSLTVTLDSNTYQAFLYTAPAYVSYGQTSFSQPSALGQLIDGLQAWDGQSIAAALNRLFSLS